MEKIKKWLIRLLATFIAVLVIIVLTIGFMVASFLVVNVKMWYMSGEGDYNVESNY